MPAPTEVDLTIGRIAFGARMLGLGWMVLLTLTAIGRRELGRPGVGWMVVLLSVAWASALLARSRSIDAWSLWVDAALAAFALLTPETASTEELIYGGFPAIAVAVAAAHTRSAGFVVAVVLSAVVAARLGVTNLDKLVGSLGEIITYGMVALIVGWAIHLIYQSDARRREAEAGRTRAEERERLAAHLHDSVLQTLALIQRDATDPARVATLARRQEAELREWLYGTGLQPSGLVAMVRAAASEVEELYNIKVEVVTVGDVEVDPRTEALAAAGHEAMVNAAKHGGIESVSVYLEVDEAGMRLFVRDRGVGFDPQAVAASRRGISDSIVRRMEQVGGRATIKSEPGRGTEVRLELGR